MLRQRLASLLLCGLALAGPQVVAQDVLFDQGPATGFVVGNVTSSTTSYFADKFSFEGEEVTSVAAAKFFSTYSITDAGGRVRIWADDEGKPGQLVFEQIFTELDAVVEGDYPKPDGTPKKVLSLTIDFDEAFDAQPHQEYWIGALGHWRRPSGGQGDLYLLVLAGVSSPADGEVAHFPDEQEEWELMEEGDLAFQLLGHGDNEPPVIESVSADPSVLWPPNHKMVEVTVMVDFEDICDSAPICRIVDVTSNELINGPGDGNTDPDWEITGDLTVDLRAERAGGGNGRVYTIHVECTDVSDNTATATVDVTVPHDKGKKK